MTAPARVFRMRSLPVERPHPARCLGFVPSWFAELLVGRTEYGACQGGLREDLREIGKLLDERAGAFQLWRDNDCIAWQQCRPPKVRVPKLAVRLAADYSAVGPNEKYAFSICLARGPSRIVQI